jgi:hypothetical protein
MNSDWEHASIEDCKHGKLFPNMLAYHEPTKTLCVIVKRSMTGTDFALSEAGLNYLLTALEKGAARKDGNRHNRGADRCSALISLNGVNAIGSPRTRCGRAWA